MTQAHHQPHLPTPQDDSSWRIIQKFRQIKQLLESEITPQTKHRSLHTLPTPKPAPYDES